MIAALLLDLGGTLVNDDRVVFPGVPDALRAILTLQTANGHPLVTCLVSDFDGAFEEYLAILDAAKLREFFEPVEERVTVSSQAGVRKPDRRIFEIALKRAKVTASLGGALFITEDGGHIAAARKLGMAVLQFGRDFHDWTNAPLLIAQAIAPSNANNLTATLKPLLAKHDVRLESIDRVSDGTVRGKARSWVKLDAPELGSLDGVHVELPVSVEAKILPSGALSDVRVAPHPDDVAEAVQQVRSLSSSKQVSEGPAGNRNSPVIPTHSVETDKAGRRILQRRRFTAW